jgi:hypothetical protein
MQMSFSEIEGSLPSRLVIFHPLDLISHCMKPATALGALSSIFRFVTFPYWLKI